MPTEEHFSEKTIAKKVNEALLSHSLTLYPAAMGFLGLLGGGLFDSSVGWIAGGVGIGLSVANYFYQKSAKSQGIASQYIDELRTEQRKALVENLGSLGQELYSLGCQQGSEQVSQLKSKFEGLNQTIREKLPHDEVNAKRLSAMAEQLYLATIENLIHAKQMLTSLNDISLDYIEKQLARAHSEEERESLLERKKLKLDGLDEIENYIAKNEIAMTKINQLSLKLAQSRKSHFDMEESLHEITNNVRVEQWESQ